MYLDVHKSMHDDALRHWMIPRDPSKLKKQAGSRYKQDQDTNKIKIQTRSRYKQDRDTNKIEIQASSDEHHKIQNLKSNIVL